MARLTAADRRAMPQSDFAGPNKSYPVTNAQGQPDAHAGLAKAMASRYEGPDAKAKIFAKADEIIARRKGRG
jgi:hypothetical protein